MRRILMFAALLSVAAWLPVRATRADEAAVRAALEHYLTAHATGDGSHLDGVFNESGRLLWVNGDTLAQRTAAEYIGSFRGQPAPDEARRRRRIEVVDVTGRAAIGKIVMDYPAAYITDYMALLKVQGEWLIVNKIVNSEPKSP